MEITSPLYFSVFIFSILVFVDLLFKFKRPLILKFHFCALVVVTGLASLTHYLVIGNAVNLVLFFMLCKAISASAFLNIFSILYFPKFRLIVNFISIGMVAFAVGFILYAFFINDTFTSYVGQFNMIVALNEGLEAPLPFRIFRWLLIISFFVLMLYFIYGIIKKYQYNNIYFDKIKQWTSFILIFCIGLLSLYLPLSMFKSNPNIGHIVTIIFYYYILLLVFYRPNFLNRSALKISFGDSFTKESEYAISELEFINEFYTKSYFTKNDASLENLAKIMNISSNDLYKFIYYKYTMTFNDLINKNRVEYFIDIIHNPKYLNYTIDALAKEAGFSSRQHLYKPFKKFHGGNPSDIVDAVNP